jgi:EAL domain-containing protein (putative c-di-GMP-specific phosphodiesterase class I)
MIETKKNFKSLNLLTDEDINKNILNKIEKENEILIEFNQKFVIFKKDISFVFFTIYIEETNKTFIIFKNNNNLFSFPEKESFNSLDLNSDSIINETILDNNNICQHILLYKYSKLFKLENEFNKYKEENEAFFFFDIDNIKNILFLNLDPFYIKYIYTNSINQLSNYKKTSKLISYLKQNKFTTYYQIVVDNKHEQTYMYQSLLRIEDNDKIILPKDFLQEAIDIGIYKNLTHIVLNNAKKIIDIGMDVVVNITEEDLKDKEIINKIFSLIKHSNNIKNNLVLEFDNLSNYSVDKTTLQDFLINLKELQTEVIFKIGDKDLENIDFFKKYNPTFFKIDFEYIKNIDNPEYIKKINKIVKFSKENNIKTIASYIENEDIFKKSKNLGIDYSLGFLFGYPFKLNID